MLDGCIMYRLLLVLTQWDVLYKKIPMKTSTCQRRKEQLVAYGIIPVFPIFGQKLQQCSEGYLEIFAVFRGVYVFVVRFLAEPLLMLRGTAELPEPPLDNFGLFHGSPIWGPPVCSIVSPAASFTNYTIKIRL